MNVNDFDLWFVETDLEDEYREEKLDLERECHYPNWDEGAQAYDEIRGV